MQYYKIELQKDAISLTVSGNLMEGQMPLQVHKKVNVYIQIQSPSVCTATNACSKFSFV